MTIKRVHFDGSLVTGAMFLALLLAGLWPAASVARILDRLSEQAVRAHLQLEIPPDNAVRYSFDDSEGVEKGKGGEGAGGAVRRRGSRVDG